MSLQPGARLGPYEIVAALGTGGMGEVYRARDLTLKRDVALKVLHEGSAQDADRVARFQREAELLATLNHSNIAAIYGLEKTDDGIAIVMELVEGETLEEKLAGLRAKGAGLPLDEVLAIAAQIADALEAAHDRGVIHRDLKPANIKITPDGSVKVLDFGLAKMLEGPGRSGGPGGFAATMSPTLSVHATYAGVILGTAAYMSPEQARGRPVDKRTDVWAFGCVVFEMLSGARPFDGEDIAEMIGAVIHKDIAWNRLPKTTPPTVRQALQKCLEKDPKLRMRDVGDVKLMMSGAFESGAPAAPVTMSAPARATTRALFAVAAVVLAAATGAAAWFLKPLPPKAGPVRFAVTPDPVLAIGSPYRDVVISPDGKSLVVHTGSNALASQLMVRPVDQLEGAVLRGLPVPSDQFVSPDGKWVGFFGTGELRKVSMTGGPSIRLCQFPGQRPSGASWGPEDTIVFATSDLTTGLMSVPAGGGEPKVLTKPDPRQSELDHVFPSFLPGGRAVLFTIVPTGGANENMHVAVLDLKTGQRKTLIRGGGQAEYAESGHIVYASAGSLRAVRFDPVRLEVLSDPVPVVEQVMIKPLGAAQFSLSRNGTLVYVAGTSSGGSAATRTLAWVDRHGKEEPVKAPPRAYVYPRVSPDGAKVALDVRDQENDIWIWDFAHETMTRLTFDPGNDTFPVWTPDGKRILFASARAGAANIFRQQADGTGTVEQLTKSEIQLSPYSISPDGTQVVLRDNGSGGGDLMLLRLGTAQTKTEGLVQTPGADANGEISPDGHWLAYQTNESGTNEIYVRPFPNVNGGRWQVSSGGGTRPLWARSGRELFFVSSDFRALMSVPVQLTPSFTSGNQQKILDGQAYVLSPPGSTGRSYDVSRDGQKFLVIKDAPAGIQRSGPAAPPSITVVLNWLDELRAKVPAR